MDWLHNLAAQVQLWWQGLSPDLREGIVAAVIGTVIGGIIVSIILGLPRLLWRSGRKIIKKLVFRKDEPPPMATKEEADGQREAMLQAVEAAWIKGVLEKSLYEEVLIALNVQDRHDLAQPPVRLAIQTPEGPPRPLPPSIDILDIFDEHGKRLLILGEPGSGKTITLLDLARKLIVRARAHAEHPLPVVFNLASWAEKRQSLDDWLIAELENKYRVPNPLGRYWVKKHEFLLLLDGLDEVGEDKREKCIEAINVYCESGVQVVVCSRRQEYEALIAETKLVAWQAILLHPLAEAQIFAYLDELKEKAEPVRKALEGDPDLLELARTPLLLNVMLMAYGGAQTEIQKGAISLDEKRSRLFDRYIHRVLLEHGSKKHPWPPSQVMTWLRWIAQGLIRHNETEFRLENLQPDWLLSTERRRYKWIAPMLFGLSAGLIGGLIGGLSGETSAGMIVGLSAGLSAGLSVAKDDTITPVVGLEWNFDFRWKTLSKNIIFGLIAGPIAGLIAGLIGGMNAGLIAGLILGLSGGLISGLITVLEESMRPLTIIVASSTPNRPIWQSGKNWLFVGLILGLILGLISGLIGGLILGLIGGLIGGLISGLILGLIFGQLYGGDAFVRHWALRFTLWRYKHTPAPWRYVAFLDYAAQRILLRRVGGGWIFIHRMIMEHIAHLDDAFIASLDR